MVHNTQVYEVRILGNAAGVRMRESEIERYFVKRVKEYGGEQRKFISPGRKGVPDRILVLLGLVFFIELKAPGKMLRPDQEREHGKLRLQGAKVLVLDSKTAVDVFLPPKT